MSSMLKFIVGIFVVLCCVQFIEMARVRRDTPDVGADLKNSLDDFLAKMKDAFNEDNMKKLVDAAQNAVAEGTKFAQEQLTKIKDTAEKTTS